MKNLHLGIKALLGLDGIKIRYTYRRKSDGHIYQAIYPLGCMEDACKSVSSFCSMVNNKLWETIGRDLFIGLHDKDNHEIFANDKIKYKKHKGYGLPNFTAIIKWNGEQACFKYEVKKPHYISANIAEIDEVKNDFLKYVKVVGNIYESKPSKRHGRIRPKAKGNRKKAK